MRNAIEIKNCYVAFTATVKIDEPFFYFSFTEFSDCILVMW